MRSTASTSLAPSVSCELNPRGDIIIALVRGRAGRELRDKRAFVLRRVNYSWPEKNRKVSSGGMVFQVGP